MANGKNMMCRTEVLKVFRLCCFALTCLFFTCGNTSSTTNTQEDYFVVTNELTPVIYDSVLTKSAFLINAIYCGPRLENRKVPSSSTLIKPLRVSNIKIEKNVEPNYPSDLYWIHYLDESTVQLHYGLYCLPRIIRRGNPPPDTRPRPYMNISFECEVKDWHQLPVKTFTESYKSSTKTVYVTTYPYIPQNTSHQVIKWQYKSRIEVFKNGHLYREYEVSDKIPEISKVRSYISKTDPMLVVEILE